MTVKGFALVVAVNALVTLATLTGYAPWIVPSRLPAYAVLDVGELYHLKERQIAAVLVKRDASDEERISALKRATAFGDEITAVVQALPAECRCLVLARGAVMGPATLLPDLTPEVARRLGL